MKNSVVKRAGMNRGLVLFTALALGTAAYVRPRPASAGETDLAQGGPETGGHDAVGGGPGGPGVDNQGPGDPDAGGPGTNGGGQGMPGPGGPGGPPRGPEQRALSGLQLTDDQKTKLQPILQDFQEKQNRLRAELVEKLKTVLTPGQLQQYQSAVRRPPPPPPARNGGAGPDQGGDNPPPPPN